MAWDFSTEPEFQKKLDWVEEFCREEVEPLDLVFPYAVRSRDPKIKALVKDLQDEIKAQGLWAIFLDEELGGPGYGQLKLGLLNEILGKYPSAPQMFGAAAPDNRQHGDARRVRHRRAERALVEADAQPGDVVGLFDDRTTGRIRPEPLQDPRGPRRRRVGDQRREVVHERGTRRRHPLRDVHQRDVRGAARHPGRRDPARTAQPQPHHLQRRARSARSSARPRGWRQGARTTPARRGPHPSRDAHDRPVQVGLRHDV